MDYYSSKSELLVWVNNVLKLQLSRLEQFATGAIFCQLLDAYFPDVVPIFKVNFYAREEYEILQNYKVLQTAFTQLQITKELNVINLIKASTVENLELLQWLYRYLRRRKPVSDYDAKHRRSLTMRGGTSDVPVPSCITASFDVYGRCQDMKFLSSSGTWVGMEPPVSSNTSSTGVPRLRTPRPGSVRSSSPASPSCMRSSMSAVPSRYREGIVTPTSSLRSSSEAGSEREASVSKPTHVSCISTQTEGVSTADTATEAAPSPTGRGSGADPAAPRPATHRRRASVDVGIMTSDLLGGLGGSGGVDAAVGTDDLKEGHGENAWRDAANATDALTDSLKVLALGVRSGDSSIADPSSRHTTRSSAGTETYAGVPPATSTFSAYNAIPADDRSAGATAAAVSSSAATDMMVGALDTVQRSSKILRKSLPGLRRLVEMLGVREALAVSTPATPASSSGGGVLAPLVFGEVDGQAAEGGAAAGAGVGAASNYTIRGKIRSLQDALQTLLRHTALLLADVQGYSAAGGGTSVGGGAQPEAAVGGVSDGGSLQAQLALRAAAMLVELRELESEFALISGMVRALDSTSGAPGSAAHSATAAASAASSAATMTSTAAAVGGAGATAAVFNEEQRALTSTAQLDACLKSVGLAQFGLVQGIHREIAQITAAFLKVEAPRTANAACNTDMTDDTAAANVRDNKPTAVAAPHKRMARVFKLGDYTLKQLRNGDVYKGRYLGNKKNGDGVYHFVNADVYEGEFKDDRMDGYGVYTFSHEGRYEGQWRNAVYSGCGTETFAKGSTYHGEYLAGLRNGWGACRFFNGDYYEGQWLKGLRDGRGMQQCTDDSNYVGDYVRGKRHGYGVYSFANSDRYVGKYADDLPDGHGVYYFASGQRYEGQWLQGRKHGWSVYTVENGSRFVGQWAEGKPQWVQPLPPGLEPPSAPAEAEEAENGEARPDEGQPTGPDGSSGQGGGAPLTGQEPLWLHLLPEDGDPMLRETITRAFDAHQQAQADARIAEQRAVEHWSGLGEIQQGIRGAVARAEAAAGTAQSARQRAQELAAKLDNAVALLQESTTGAGLMADGGGSGVMQPADSASRMVQDQMDGATLLTPGTPRKEAAAM